jgi:hypothetical protein
VKIGPVVKKLKAGTQYEDVISLLVFPFKEGK